MSETKLFRKKPVVIEAEQFVGSKIRGVCIDSGKAGCDSRPHLHTIHKGQIVILDVGDWIIPEPDGEHYYPCKPDIFEQTYEPTDARSSPWVPILSAEDLPKEEGAYVWWLRLGSSRIVQYFLPNALTNAKFVREYAAYWSQPIEPYKEPTNEDQTSDAPAMHGSCEA